MPSWCGLEHLYFALQLIHAHKNYVLFGQRSHCLYRFVFADVNVVEYTVCCGMCYTVWGKFKPSKEKLPPMFVTFVCLWRLIYLVSMKTVMAWQTGHQECDAMYLPVFRGTRCHHLQSVCTAGWPDSEFTGSACPCKHLPPARHHISAYHKLIFTIMRS